MQKRDKKPVTKKCLSFKDAHAFIILNALIEQRAKNSLVDNYIAKTSDKISEKIILSLLDEHRN